MNPESRPKFSEDFAPIAVCGMMIPVSSGFRGADVEQLEMLANKFDVQAARIEEIVTSSSGMLFLAEWTGANVERLRSDWNRTARPSLQALAASLKRNADNLKRQALEQREASAGGHTVGGGEGSAYGGSKLDANPGPSSTADLIDGIRDMNDKEDAFNIQKVIGSDGVERFIVYISGTGSASGGLMSDAENINASFGLNTHTRENLERLIAEHIGGQTDAEIMLVGHSQGGMYAEAIAASGRFNVSEVVAVGAPGVPVSSGYGGANVTRLQHGADWAVGATEGFRSVLLGPQTHGAIVIGADGGLDNSGYVETFRAGNPLEGFRGEDILDPWNSQAHVLDNGDYNWLAAEYDASNDPSIVAARERQAKFLNGTVVSDADADSR